MTALTFVATAAALGIVYGLIGAAVSIVAAATRTLHLAIGEVLVAGLLAQLTLAAAAAFGVPAWLAIVGGLAVGAAVSAALEPAVFRALPPGLTWLIGLVVAGGVIEALVARTLGTATLRPDPLLPGGIAGAGADVTSAVVLGLPAVAALALAVRSTRWGHRLRLVGASPAAAERIGVSPPRTRTAALAACGAAATLAGMLVAPIAFVGVGQGAGFTVRGVAAAALLGRGGPGWALAGGLLLGVAETAAQSVWPDAGPDVIVAAVVLVVLAGRGSEQSRAWGRAW